MQFRIFKEKVALAHGALHFHDAMAHQAAKAGASFRKVYSVLYGRLKLATVKQRRVMTAGAPLRRANTGDFLHVLDALAIPLIVERRKMVHRAVPLRIDVRVTALAGFGFHEILRGDIDVASCLRGTREEFSAGAVAFVIHGVRRHQRIDDAIGSRVAPGDFAHRPKSCGDSEGYENQGRKSQRMGSQSLSKPPLRTEPVRKEQQPSRNTKNNVRV